MSLAEFRIRDLAKQVRGLSYKKELVLNEPEAGYVPVLRANNINKNFQIVYKDLIYLPEEIIREDQFLQEGDILIAASSGSVKVVGRGARFSGKLRCSFGAFCKVIRPVSQKVLSGYIAHYFQSLRYRREIANLAIGANILNIKNRDIDNLILIAPGNLNAQREIVTALDKAKALIELRLEELQSLDKLEKNLFLHYFQHYLITAHNQFQTLDHIANVVSGITKGRKTREADLYEVPYLRVANVQDGYFDLSEIKTIEVTASEIERYRIEKGDLLLTEGGDPNKLGRGDVWSEDETDFIFQNHLFRVRIKDRKKYLPSFLNALTGSDFGRAYFLKQAKQTTGIASINSRQMKAFPVPMVPMEEQTAFEHEIKALKAMRIKLQHHSLPELETLFQSLLQRAFHGDLTIDPDLQLDGYLENENFEAIATDAVLIQTLIDRFNQDKTDALSDKREMLTEEDGDEDSQTFRFETEATYNRAKDALFHLLKEGLVTQKTPEKEEEPFKTYLATI